MLQWYFFYNIFVPDNQLLNTKIMKTTKNRKKPVISVIVLLLSVIVMIAIGCKSGSQRGSELSDEVQDVQEEASEMIAAEKADIRSKVDSTIAIFNDQIASLESDLQEKNEQLNSEKEALINELKATSDSLTVKLSEIENQTAEEWEAFKTELEHDLNVFHMGVQDFFQDNE